MWRLRTHAAMAERESDAMALQPVVPSCGGPRCNSPPPDDFLPIARGRHHDSSVLVRQIRGSTVYLGTAGGATGDIIVYP